MIDRVLELVIESWTSGVGLAGAAKEAAREAEQAAAAAAADSCATCGEMYGDNIEKDGLWIACDKCNKWYHGACVNMTQVRKILGL